MVIIALNVGIMSITKEGNGSTEDAVYAGMTNR
jgi:hypothetical protein